MSEDTGTASQKRTIPWVDELTAIRELARASKAEVIVVLDHAVITGTLEAPDQATSQARDMLDRALNEVSSQSHAKAAHLVLYSVRVNPIGVGMTSVVSNMMVIDMSAVRGISWGKTGGNSK